MTADSKARILALAAVLGLASAGAGFGAQFSLHERRNMPGERLRPPGPKPKHQDHDEAEARIAAAVRKRERKAVFLARQWTGSRL